MPHVEPDDAGPAPETRRARIWERPGDAEAVEEMIADGKAWPELFRRRPVRKAWKEARAGKGHEHWEAVFNRIAWREGFEEHLRELARAATAEPGGGGGGAPRGKAKRAPFQREKRAPSRPPPG